MTVTEILRLIGDDVKVDDVISDFFQVSVSTHENFEYIYKAVDLVKLCVTAI